MQTHDHDADETPQHESIDEIDFVPPRESLARTRSGPRSIRRSMEPQVVRSLGIALVVGAVLGTAIFYFKPTPRAANANPLPMVNEPREPAPVKKRVELFELPEWNENEPTPPRES